MTKVGTGQFFGVEQKSTISAKQTNKSEWPPAGQLSSVGQYGQVSMGANQLVSRRPVTGPKGNPRCLPNPEIPRASGFLGFMRDFFDFTLHSPLKASEIIHFAAKAKTN